MRRHIYIIFFIISFYSITSAQGIIEGVVLDQNGEPVIAATIGLKGTTKGAITDFDGFYRIENLNAGDYTLEVTYVGYRPEERKVTLEAGETLKENFTIKEDAETLDEVVVVGYGVQRKRDIVGSLEQVDGDKLEQTSVPSFEAALQGQAAGVSVMQGSGMAGANSMIRIRGAASISSAGDPLYVIDGIPIDNNKFLAEANWQNGAFNNNPLAMLNPAEIESIEILKDAAAAGIYGSRGSNGVILITTKRGKSKKPTFNLQIGYGTSNAVAKPDLLNGQEWLQLRQEAWENDGNTGAVWIPNYSAAQDSPEDRAAAYALASQYNTDWWDMLTRTGFKQSYNLSSNFGIGDRVKAFASLAYSDNQSYIDGNAYERFNARLNLDANILKNLKLTFSGSYNKGINDRVRVSYTGGLGDAMSTALPIYPVYDSTTASGYWRGFNSTSAPNPLLTNDHFQGYTLDDRIISSAQLIFTPTEKLTITASGGYDYLQQHNDFYESAILRQDIYGMVERDIREVNNFNTFVTADYSILDDTRHNLKLMLGTEYQETQLSGTNNLQYIDSTFRNVNTFVESKFGNYNYDTQNSRTFSNEITKFLSFFTRANYILDDRYIFQGTARIDGSSKFGPANRYAFFPTLSAGWILSEESFFKSDIVNFFKIKAGYGLFGNSNIGQNQFLSRYQRLENSYNNEPILFPLSFANEDLRWETTSNIDMGIIAGLWDDLFQVELNYYRKNTRDVLLLITLPNYNASGQQYTDNVGEILNEGIELDLTANIFRRDNFVWTINGNLAYNYNEILDIGEFTEDAVSGGTNDTRVVEGYPVGTNYLIPYLGVDPATGRPIYEDADGTPTFEYDEQGDRKPVGDVLPSLIGGFTNSFTWKRFDLSFLFVYSIGQDIYDSSSKRQFTMLTDWNVDRRALDRWTPDNRDATYPIATLDFATWGNDKEWFNTSQWIHDASYMRLRNVNFGYQIPKSLIGGISAKVILSATNLLTFTNFQGLDPEVVRDFDNVTDRNLSPNITYLTPPQERAFNLRLNVQF